ncbi:MAG TPA: hypothetical protein VFK86_14360 [Bauldia sp.]|nr:hypothetical protein [Bauldia sp.]
MNAAEVFAWTSLVPFAAGQAVALEIRKFVFTIKGDGRVTELSDETVGLHMHVPPQLGIEETALDLALTWRGSEGGNGLRLDTTRKGQTRRTEHDDMRMTVLPSAKVRVERAATGPDDKDMAFTIARSGAQLAIGDILGFGQLDGATITLRAG